MRVFSKKKQTPAKNHTLPCSFRRPPSEGSVTRALHRFAHGFKIATDALDRITGRECEHGKEQQRS